MAMLPRSSLVNANSWPSVSPVRGEGGDGRDVLLIVVEHDDLVPPGFEDGQSAADEAAALGLGGW